MCTNRHYCVYCQIELTTTQHSTQLRTVDHFIPRCRGGDDSPQNLFWACKACNEEKDGMMPAHYLAYLENIMNNPTFVPVTENERRISVKINSLRRLLAGRHVSRKYKPSAKIYTNKQERYATVRYEINTEARFKSHNQKQKEMETPSVTTFFGEISGNNIIPTGKINIVELIHLYKTTKRVHLTPTKGISHHISNSFLEQFASGSDKFMVYTIYLEGVTHYFLEMVNSVFFDFVNNNLMYDGYYFQDYSDRDAIGAIEFTCGHTDIETICDMKFLSGALSNFQQHYQMYEIDEETNEQISIQHT